MYTDMLLCLTNREGAWWKCLIRNTFFFLTRFLPAVYGVMLAENRTEGPRKLTGVLKNLLWFLFSVGVADLPSPLLMFQMCV